MLTIKNKKRDQPLGHSPLDLVGKKKKKRFVLFIYAQD